MEFPQASRFGQRGQGQVIQILLAFAVLCLLGYGVIQWRTTNRSPIEAMLAKAMKKAGLPEPVAQLQVRERGRLVTIPDFAYPQEKVAINGISLGF